MKLGSLSVRVLVVLSYLWGGMTGCAIAQRDSPATPTHVAVRCSIVMTTGDMLPLAFDLDANGVTFNVGGPIESATCRTAQ